MAIQSEVFMWCSEMECLARPELEALQLERLTNTVDQAYNCVPFYRDRLDKAGVRPDSLKSVSDICRLPFTEKNDLRDNYPFGLLAVPRSDLARLHASSGTRGKPTVVGYTKHDLETWAEVCARSLATAGARPHDVVQNSYGYGLFTGGMGIHAGAERLGATVIPASSGRTQQQLLLLKDLQARVLCCTPSYALNIAFTLEELCVKREELNLQIGIFGAEPWTEELREQLEERLGITAVDIYGLSEIMGPGVSMECPQGRNGLHIWEDHFLAEIVDPESGEPLAAGEEGELVFTTLTKQALPLIRYRTGDISRLYYERCACGRTMVRMARVRARLDDMLIIRGVNVYPSEVEKALLQIEELAPHYQLVLSRAKALDTMDIQIEVTEEILSSWGSFEDGQVELSALTSKVQLLLKDNLGLTAAVTLMRPKSIPRSEGKAVRIVDQRTHLQEKTSKARPKERG